MTHFISAPMVNVNEEVMQLVEWSHKQGDSIHRGEVIGILETTKSTYELQADVSGYFFPIVPAGEQVKIGQIIAALTENPEEEIKLPSSTEDTRLAHDQSAVSPERRWTKKAELLAKKHKIDIESLLANLGAGAVLSEKDVLDMINKAKTKSEPAFSKTTRNVNQTQRILVLGGGNIAVLVMDIISRIPNQRAVAILDDNAVLHGSTVMGCPILGKLDEAYRLWKDGFFDYLTLAIGVLPLRFQLYDRFSALGIPFGNIIDPSALVLSDVLMGDGNLVMGFCRIGPQTIIGNNNFLSAYVNLEHHNRLGDHCTFGPGVMTSGGVMMGNRVRFGTGIFVEPRLTIGDDVTIASGVILTTNVPDGVIVRTRSNFSFYRPGQPVSEK